MPKLEDLVKVPSGGYCNAKNIPRVFQEHTCGYIVCTEPNIVYLTKENYTRWLTVKLTKA